MIGLVYRKSADLKFAAVTATCATPKEDCAVCVTVTVTVDVETSSLPELADDNCNSTIPTPDAQTIITITMAAIGLLTPALPENDFRPVISSNRLRMCQESDKTYELSIHVRDISSAPPTRSLLRSRPGCFIALGLACGTAFLPMTCP